MNLGALNDRRQDAAMPQPVWSPAVHDGAPAGGVGLVQPRADDAYDQIEAQARRGAMAMSQGGAPIARREATQDPVQRNREVTRRYHDQSQALSALIGAPDGRPMANWCTFACWASDKIGLIIQGEVPKLNLMVPVAKVLKGLGLWGPIGGPIAEGMAASNFAIAEDKQPKFDEFLKRFSTGERSEASWEGFEAWLRSACRDPEAFARCREGFRAYFEAITETDPDRKAELVFLGNLWIVYDEQHHIDQALRDTVPAPLWPLATRVAGHLQLPEELLWLTRPIPEPARHHAADRYLDTIDDQERFAAWIRENPSWETDRGTVGDWSRLDERMRFITRLFRTRQFDPSLHRDPHADPQTGSTPEITNRYRVEHHPGDDRLGGSRVEQLRQAVTTARLSFWRAKAKSGILQAALLDSLERMPVATPNPSVNKHESRIPGRSPEEVFAYLRQNAEEIFSSAGLSMNPPLQGELSEGFRTALEYQGFPGLLSPIEVHIDAKNHRLELHALDGHFYRGVNTFALEQDGPDTIVRQEIAFQKASVISWLGHVIGEADLVQEHNWRSVHQHLFRHLRRDG